MDVLELPRPVINFLRTMSKEMHRYSLCWDIYGGSDGVTLTLTWKMTGAGGGGIAGAASSSSSSSNNEATSVGTSAAVQGGAGDLTDGEQDTTSTAINFSASSGPPLTQLGAASSTDLAHQILMNDAYTKKQHDSTTTAAGGFISDSGGASAASTKKRVIGCAKLQLAKCGGSGGKHQQMQHGKLDDLANRNIAQMNGRTTATTSTSHARNLSAESRLKASANNYVQQYHPSNTMTMPFGSKYDPTMYNEWNTSSFMGDRDTEDDDYRLQGFQQQQQQHQHHHQSRRPTSNQQQQNYPRQQPEICPDCPKCNNMNQYGEQLDTRSSRKQQENSSISNNNMNNNNKLGTLANQLNKKVSKMVRGKSLESRAEIATNSYEANEPAAPIRYKQQPPPPPPTYYNQQGDIVCWREQVIQSQSQPTTQSSLYRDRDRDRDRDKPLPANNNSNSNATTSTTGNEQQLQQMRISGKYESNAAANNEMTSTANSNNKFIIRNNRQQSAINNVGAYQNYEAAIPIAIQQQDEPSELLESTNSGTYFTSGCNYTDLENLSPNNNVRQQQQQQQQQQYSTIGTSNPWIRRNYPSQQSDNYPIIQQSSSHNATTANTSNNKQQQQQEQPVEINKKSSSSMSGGNSIVCETSLFNRVERENILSIVESTTSSSSRSGGEPNNPNNSSANNSNENVRSNPSYFYANLQQQQQQQSPNQSNTNNNAAGSNKVTFDPNLEYI